MHVFLAITKKSYLSNDKYLEANTKAVEGPRYTLSKDHIFLISHCDSAFAVWNTFTSPEQQTTSNVEREAIVDESDEACYIV